jgi:hypothetical protein
MFGRFEKDLDTLLPNEWSEGLISVLDEAFVEELKNQERFFEVYGGLSDQELIVIISAYHRTEANQAPYSLFISHNRQGSWQEMKQVLNDLTDFASEVFSEIFSNQEWSDFNDIWTENPYEKSHFYYKVTRENISLTIQANELLKTKS